MVQRPECSADFKAPCLVLTGCWGWLGGGGWFGELFVFLLMGDEGCSNRDQLLKQKADMVVGSNCDDIGREPSGKVSPLHKYTHLFHLLVF